MKALKISLGLLLATALLLPAGWATAQDRTEQIEEQRMLLEEVPSRQNRERLAQLLYLQGVDQVYMGNYADAISNLQQAVWTLEDGEGITPENAPIFQEARYALGYAYYQDSQIYEAMLVLDQAVNASPDFDRARFLLATTLIEAPGDRSDERALNVLRALRGDGDEDHAAMATRTAARLMHNRSTALGALGENGEAVKMLRSLKADFGQEPGASVQENTQIEYAHGIFYRDSGDLLSALQHLEAAHSMTPDYMLHNGTALEDVLARVSFNAGVELIDEGSAMDAMVALDVFNQAGKLDDEDRPDVHHGLAVAYYLMEEDDQSFAELQRVGELDQQYLQRIIQ